MNRWRWKGIEFAFRETRVGLLILLGGLLLGIRGTRERSWVVITGGC